LRAEGLTPEELGRYDRQLRIRGLGVGGQLKLRRAEVAVVGVGGLGCPTALYLAAAGVGHLRLIDHGLVEPSNLNRQVLYRPEDVGRPKAEVAAERLRELNPHVEVEPVPQTLDEHNAHELLGGADVVVDGLDNWRTRFIVNRTCVELGVPYVHAGVRGLYGQVTTILPGRGPCLRCLVKATPVEEGALPILGATCAILAGLEALEAVKLITGLGKPLVGRLLIFDGLEMKLEEVMVRRDAFCPVCGASSKR